MNNSSQEWHQRKQGWLSQAKKICCDTEKQQIKIKLLKQHQNTSAPQTEITAAAWHHYTFVSARSHSLYISIHRSSPSQKFLASSIAATEAALAKQLQPRHTQKQTVLTHQHAISHNSFKTPAIKISILFVINEIVFPAHQSHLSRTPTSPQVCSNISLLYPISCPYTAFLHDQHSELCTTLLKRLHSWRCRFQKVAKRGYAIVPCNPILFILVSNSILPVSSSLLVSCCKGTWVHTLSPSLLLTWSCISCRSGALLLNFILFLQHHTVSNTTQSRSQPIAKRTKGTSWNLALQESSKHE